MKTILSSFIVFLLVVNTVNAQEDSGKVKQAIMDNCKKMEQAMDQSNYEEFGSYFTKDAMMKLTGEEPLMGRDAIVNMHKPMAEQKMKLDINTEEVYTYGDYATEIGSYKIMTADGQQVDKGYYSTLWKKSDGEWKIFRDMISSSMKMEHQ